MSPAPIPAALRSHLLTGTVGHRRERHAAYAFTNQVWYLALDLDELEELDRRFRWFTANGRALLAIRDADYLERGHRGLRDEVRRRASALGLEPDRLRVTLVTYPRIAGYVFNPVSFYLCHEQPADGGGPLRLVIAEVHNTHGDRALYDFLPAPPGAAARAAGAEAVFRGEHGKRMYVSPFVGADAHYELRVSEDDGHIAISIDAREVGEAALFASLELERRALNGRELLRVLARDPLVPHKTSALIFLHAVRLWLRGVPWTRYRRRPARGDGPAER